VAYLKSLVSSLAKGHIGAMLHMVKLAVGIRDIAHLREVQAIRAANRPPLRHQTRSHPRRAGELTDGGSIFWVIAGAVLVRQRILDVIEDRWDDDTACAGLVLDPTLVPVHATPMRAFQGWRYLAPEAAPPDLEAIDPALATDMPVAMRRSLQSLGLL
jgi:hypothetical protein